MCGLQCGRMVAANRVGDAIGASQSAHRIGQVVMGLILKRVADGKWRVFWDGQSIGLGKLRANVTPRVAFDQRMVFEPHQKAFFELATKRLPDGGTRFEAGNPS
jgi:hypothetical protein